MSRVTHSFCESSRTGSLFSTQLNGRRSEAFDAKLLNRWLVWRRHQDIRRLR
jgi:hypothetical protein